MKAVQVEPGRVRGPEDGSRRYTPSEITFDTRAMMLSTVIEDDWEPDVAAQWRRNQASLREVLIHEYGAHDYEQRIQNFLDLGAAPWSVVALHNIYLAQVRAAFVSGSYYPALLGACGLGERILNQLVLTLRDSYSAHTATKHVAYKASLDDWGKCIKTLRAWGVFDSGLAKQFTGLMRVRHGAVHYRSEMDRGDARDAALKAVQLLGEIVGALFNPHASGEHYFGGPIGRSYVKIDSEDDPFIKHFVIPACVLVSPVYRFVANSNATSGFDVYDDADYGIGVPPLTDDEFAEPSRATPQVALPF